MMAKYRGKYKRARICAHTVSTENLMVAVEVATTCPYHNRHTHFKIIPAEVCKECDKYEKKETADA